MQAIRATVTTAIKPRARKVRILATLGPASSSPEMIRKLSEAGADAFRINMSRTRRKVALVANIRAWSRAGERRLCSTCGTKLRVGEFEGGAAVWRPAIRSASTANPNGR